MLRILNIIGGIVAVYAITHQEVFQSQLWLLPFLYTILLYICRTANESISGRPGFIALNLTMFFRYVLSVYVFYSTAMYGSYTSDYNNIQQAAYLMAYEEIAVFIAIWYIQKKQNILPDAKELSVKAGSSMMPILLCLFTIVVIGATFMHLGIGFNIFLSGNYNNFYDIESNIGQGSHYIEILWQSLWVWLYVYVLFLIKKRYDKDKSSFDVIIAIICTFIFILITFIEQTAINRWYTIMTTASTLALLVKLFPQRSKSIMFTIVIPPALVVFLATLIKNAGYVSGDGSIGDAFNTLLNSSEMDSYFAGPVDVSNAISLYQTGKADFTNMFNDIFNSFPALGRLLDAERSTAIMFNRALGRGDLIIPLIGQSLNYFGYILSPLLSVISVFICLRFDNKYREGISYLTYLWGFVAVWFGMEAMALNLTINTNWLFIRIIPFFIVLTITNRKYKIYNNG